MEVKPIDMKGYAVAGTEWLYPHEHRPPAGVKLALLTKGGIQVTGEWSDFGGFIAWQYLFRRNKAKEAALSEVLKC